MAHQRRGYAATAAAEAEERMLRGTYAAARSDYASRLYGSDAELSPDHAPRPPAARRAVSFTAGAHGAAAAAARGPFLFHFDADDSDTDSDRSSGGLEEEPQMRTAHSEPVLHTTNDVPRPRPPFQRSQTFSRPSTDSGLDASEREALLQRVRQLSASEAAAAAAAARAQAEAASLAEEAQHWRGVAKEAVAARRAAREALAELSAENARLAAALSASRLEAAAAQEALENERMTMGSRLEQYGRAFLAAKKHVAALEREAGRRPGSAGLSPSPANAPRPASPPQPATAAWDTERQELLSLLERLQEQLAAHAAAQAQQAEPSPARPPSARRRHASPPSPASPASASDASEAGTPFTAFYATASASRAARTPGATPTRTPSAAAAAAAGIFPGASPASARTAYKPPSSATGPASQAPTPEQEPLGPELPCESSFESASTTAGVPSAAATPAAAPSTAAPTPPLSSDTARATATPAADQNSQQATNSNAVELKAAGDRAVRHKRYNDAAEQYTAALTALEASNGDATATASLLCRRAAALAAAGRLLESAADCCRAEQVAGAHGCLRAVDLRAEAYSLMGAFDLAAEDLGRLRQSGAAAPAAAARLADARRAAGDSAPRNHYAILGVKPSAGGAEVKAAYRGLALRLHPDKAAATLGRDAATALFSLLSAAHATLSNSQARRAYDLQLLRHKYSGGGEGSSSSGGTRGRPSPTWR